MQLEIILAHWALGILLFFIINWLGRHSYSLGYMEVSLFVKAEEAPALNFLIRVLSPVVFLIIVSSILYYFKLDKYVHNIYLSNIYYLIFRLAFNIITGRSLLLNWYRQLLYWLTIIIVSYVVYQKLISIKKNILPDFASISNELWIIILVFLFHLTNKIRFNQDSTIKRKERYLQAKYEFFKKKFGELISSEIENDWPESIVYSILIYENFNRPRIARLIENIRFRTTRKPHTLGIMQVYSTQLLTDIESVQLGIEKIKHAYARFIEDCKIGKTQFYGDWSAYNYIIADYNGGSSYRSGVEELLVIVRSKFYPNSQHSLKP
jgi:hypothetical protein